jgi:hypothetical protein
MSSQIYVLEAKEDSGMHIYEHLSLYGSIDALMEGINSLYDMLSQGYSDIECDEVNDDEVPEAHLLELHYYSPKPTFKDVPLPTKKYIINRLHVTDNNNKSMILKIGREFGGHEFACEVYVYIRPLNAW